MELLRRYLWLWVIVVVIFVGGVIVLIFLFINKCISRSGKHRITRLHRKSDFSVNSNKYEEGNLKALTPPLPPRTQFLTAEAQSYENLAEVSDHEEDKHDYEEATPDYEQDKHDYEESTPDYVEATPDYEQDKHDYEQDKHDYEESTPDYEQDKHDYEQDKHDYEESTPDYVEATPDEAMILPPPPQFMDPDPADDNISQDYDDIDDMGADTQGEEDYDDVA